MPHSRRFRALVATVATGALSFTLLGADVTAAADGGDEPDATRVALPRAVAGDPVRPAWPGGSFGKDPGKATSRAALEVSGPGDQATLADSRPELVVDRQRGARAYEFVIGTGDSPRTGQVTSSGWVSTPRWTVPAGLLRDGGAYQWTVRTKDRSGKVGEDAPARSFTVDQRLGAQSADGPVPTDTLGPLTVNLANGNVAASVNTPQVPTGSGTLGATFSYNSLAAAEATGLTGQYYAGDSATGIDAKEKPEAVRNDARIDFRWGKQAPPYPKATSDQAFRVRWTGKLRVPRTGLYALGGTYDRGLRVLLDGKPVLDDFQGAKSSGDRAAYGKKRVLRAGRDYDLTVEYRGRADDGPVGLWARGAGRSAPVPASWLQPSGAVLPPGWRVTPDAEGPDTAGAVNAPANSGTGAGPGPSGGAANAEEGSSAGAPSSAGTAGSAGRAGSAGTAGSARTADGAAGAADERDPADTTAQIEAAEEEGLKFFYAGSPECTDSSAPKGYVCAVRVPGAGTTHLVYRAGKLTRFVNPGNETTDLGFTADHRLTSVRPPLVMDWIAVDPARRDTYAARYQVAYQPGSSATVRRLTGPEPTGSPYRPYRRPHRGYAFATGATEIRVAGVRTAQGWARKVGYDAAGTLLSDTDGTRRTTRYTWTEAGQPASTTDAGGRMSTTVYNEAGLPVGSYGPGPAKCYGKDLRPLTPAPDGCGKIPTETKTYAPTAITTTRADSDGVPRRVTEDQLNAFGLPTASVTDPEGLALKTAYEFNERFMPVAQTQPNGTRKTFAYYGANERVDNPCTDAKDPAPQRGLPKSVSLPTGSDGSARVERFVYDKRGLPVAVNLGGADWTCVTYDERGQITRMRIPGNASLPARTVDYDSTHDGDPLTMRAAQDDHAMVNTVDLLNRTVRYTDGHGTVTELGYDRADRLVRERVTPPSAKDTAQVTRTRYDAAGRIRSVELSGKKLAEVAHDASGDVARVRYGNGTQLSVVRDAAGRITARDWTLADGGKLPARVTRSQSGTIVDESVAGQDARPDGPNFRYDAAGRLVQAWMTGHEYGRDFTSKALAACPSGTRANAGANGNLVQLTDRTARGSEVTGYCYDDADRLLATTGDHPLSQMTYGVNGHVTAYTADGAKATQRQDSVERYLGGSVSGPGAADVTYTKDIADHLTAREATSSKQTTRLLYGHTEMNDPDPDLVLRMDKRLLARVIALPGGVILSSKAESWEDGQTTWSHPTVRGDIFLVTDGGGRQVGKLHQYGLYGEALAKDGTVDPDLVPDNLPGDHDYGWLGQHQVPTEHEGAQYSVVLGTRVLNTTFGRFSAPVSSGPFLNGYEYMAGDPINHTSIDGYQLYVEKES